MPVNRRQFFKAGAAAAAGAALPSVAAARPEPREIIKPPRLKPGDTVGLVNPAGVLHNRMVVREIEQKLDGLGLNMHVGRHVYDRYGYLGGTDENRAADVMRMFENPRIDAVMAVRGGWGCARILPLLDYDRIRANPKIITGYSDITSLLIAIYVKAGLVTFHGLVGVATWNPFSLHYFRRVLFEADRVTFENPVAEYASSAHQEHLIHIIHGGTARGRLIGGNLSVIAGMVGSDFVPPWNDHVLFLEEVREDVYRVDRMITHLKLAGVLDSLEGFVFGKCTRCDPAGRDSLHLEDLWRDHIRPLGIPAWYGAMIGHIADKFTVPIGVEAEIDGLRGRIRMLEPAVS